MIPTPFEVVVVTPRGVPTKEIVIKIIDTKRPIQGAGKRDQQTISKAEAEEF